MQEDLLLIVFAGAVLYYQLSRSSMKTLMSILLMCIFVGVVFYYVFRNSRQAVATKKAEETKVAQSLEGRKEVVSTAYPVKKHNGKIKYLQKNAVFMDIVKDLRFVRIFDKARYGDLIIHMDRLQKVYMYILARRYSCEQHIPVFVDLRDQVTEMLYSLYIIVPEALQHTYGIHPHTVIENNVNQFTAITRRMLEILKAFCKDEGSYYPELLPRPYETARENRLP